MEHQMLSLADQVFDVIERDILNGTLERGEYLTETALSDRLGVSRTPVREAMADPAAVSKVSSPAVSPSMPPPSRSKR